MLARRRRSPVLRFPLLVMVLVLALGSSGCGADGSFESVETTVGGPRVAHPRFEGDWQITEVEIDDLQIELVQRPALQIDASFGALTVLPGCNTHFGSFTLGEDGTASFSVIGGSELTCEPLRAQEEAVLAVLDDVTAWTPVEGGFRFTGPSSSMSVNGPNN